MDFSAVEKSRGMKFCVRVGLLSGQILPHSGGQRSKVNGQDDQGQKTRLAL